MATPLQWTEQGAAAVGRGPLWCRSNSNRVLTVLIRPRLGYVAASQEHQEAYNTNIFHQKGSENDLGLILVYTNSTAFFFFVSVGTLDVRRFGDRTNPSVSIDPKRVVPGKV